MLCLRKGEVVFFVCVCVCTCLWEEELGDACQGAVRALGGMTRAKRRREVSDPPTPPYHHPSPSGPFTHQTLILLPHSLSSSSPHPHDIKRSYLVILLVLNSSTSRRHPFIIIWSFLKDSSISTNSLSMCPRFIFIIPYSPLHPPVLSFSLSYTHTLTFLLTSSPHSPVPFPAHLLLLPLHPTTHSPVFSLFSYTCLLPSSSSFSYHPIMFPQPYILTFFLPKEVVKGVLFSQPPS